MSGALATAAPHDAFLAFEKVYSVYAHSVTLPINKMLKSKHYLSDFLMNQIILV